MGMSQEEWNNEAPVEAQFNNWTVIGPAFPQTRKIDGATEWFVPCKCKCGYYSSLKYRLESGMKAEDAIANPKVAVGERRWKKSRLMLTAFGETKSYGEWANDPRCTVCRGHLRKRVREYGMLPEDAITAPNRKVIDGT